MCQTGHPLFIICILGGGDKWFASLSKEQVSNLGLDPWKKHGKKLGFTVGTKFTAEGRDQSYQRGDLRGRAPGYPSHMVPRHPSVVVQAMGAQA